MADREQSGGLADIAGRPITATRDCLVVSYQVKHAFTVSLSGPGAGYVL